MARYREHIVTLMLLISTTLILPPAWLHECPHSDEIDISHHTDGQQVSSDHEDCALCDFILTDFQSGPILQTPQFLSPLLSFQPLSKAEALPSFHRFAPTRAPPFGSFSC